MDKGANKSNKTDTALTLNAGNEVILIERNENNKEIFSRNLQKYMELFEKSRKDICDDLGYSYYTVTDWVKGRKYPRMDKVERLARYFGINKSDLIEDKQIQKEIEGRNEILTEITSRLAIDLNFLEVVKKNLDDDEFLSLSLKLCKLSEQQLSSVANMLETLLD